MAATFAGIGAAGPRTGGPGRWHADGALIALAIEFVLAVLALTLRSIRRRSPQPGCPTGRLRLMLSRTISTTMGIVAAVVVSSLVWPSLRTFYANPIRFMPRYLKQRRFPSTHITHRFAGLTSTEVGFLRYLGLALLLLLIIMACFAVLRRGGRTIRPSEAAGQDGMSLRQAIDSGLQALHSATAARPAIIACYLAMEASLDAAGAAKGIGETADELLARATQSGLLHGASARQLTALFSEARYSSHELPDSAREDARRALEAIYADLSLPAAAAARGAP